MTTHFCSIIRPFSTVSDLSWAIIVLLLALHHNAPKSQLGWLNVLHSPTLQLPVTVKHQVIWKSLATPLSSLKQWQNTTYTYHHIVRIRLYAPHCSVFKTAKPPNHAIAIKKDVSSSLDRPTYMSADLYFTRDSSFVSYSLHALNVTQPKPATCSKVSEILKCMSEIWGIPLQIRGPKTTFFIDFAT